jgi:hypothetical protein
MHMLRIDVDINESRSADPSSDTVSFMSGVRRNA